MMNIFFRSCCQFSKSNKQCFYKILNISTDASQEQVKNAYFDLAKKYHPDANMHQTINPEKFREIQEAYSTLSNEEKRKYYDQENGIIGQQYQGDTTFGDQEDVYQKYARMNREEIRNNESKYTDYFDKQYFQNKDYFKRKLDEDSHWNMSFNLYKKHQDNIVSEKESYVMHIPTASTYYWEKKDNFKPVDPYKNHVKLFYESKYLLMAAALIGITYGFSHIFNQQNQNKQQISKTQGLVTGSGYRIKSLPLNVG